MKKRVRFINEHHAVWSGCDSRHQPGVCLHAIREVRQEWRLRKELLRLGAPGLFDPLRWAARGHSNPKLLHGSWIDEEAQPERFLGQPSHRSSGVSLAHKSHEMVLRRLQQIAGLLRPSEFESSPPVQQQGKISEQLRAKPSPVRRLYSIEESFSADRAQAAIRRHQRGYPHNIIPIWLIRWPIG
jgi:hypothetical protein